MQSFICNRITKMPALLLCTWQSSFFFSSLRSPQFEYASERLSLVPRKRKENGDVSCWEGNRVYTLFFPMINFSSRYRERKKYRQQKTCCCQMRRRCCLFSVGGGNIFSSVKSLFAALSSPEKLGKLKSWRFCLSGGSFSFSSRDDEMKSTFFFSRVSRNYMAPNEEQHEN